MSFDFGKHVGKKSATDLTDPLALFQSLDRKATHLTLRPAQAAAVRELHALKERQDVVLKMPTGTGKSTVGLLFLKSKMTELKRPGVYLCPTVQLVEQVLNEAQKIGVKAHHYAQGEPHPHPECMSGEAVTVCTYKKMFNARTTFDRSDVNLTPAALVLDDAHAGVEEIRDAFTLTLRDKAIVTELQKILDAAGRSYAISRWEELTTGRRGAASMEIPYWSWRTVVPAVRAFLGALSDRDDLKFVKFVWPHLQDILPWCRCVVSPLGIEIVPPVPPVERVRPYREAAHRLFMSATLADDAVLVRELGCSAEAALTPVSPGGEAFGERLVLVPSLIDRSLNLEWVQKWCAGVRSTWRVVVLCSSEKDAKKWGALGARVVLGDDVATAVRDLKAGAVNFVAFANRYDGVDLPDDACRILVLDGLPVGQSIVDGHDGSIRGTLQNRITYRIEQGMGRAVRSAADYAVVILAGAALANFTAKAEVREQLSADARAQIVLAHELPAMARADGHSGNPADIFTSMVGQCLARSAGWRQFYDERVRAAVGTTAATIERDRVVLAGAERAAITRAYDGNAPGALDALQKALEVSLSRDKVKASRKMQRDRAHHLQTLASFAQEFDIGRALELQNSAFDQDRDVLRPASGSVKRRASAATLEQPASLLQFYGSFENPNAFLAQLETIRSSLSFEAEFHRFEQGLKELADFVGAEGSRPERELGEGWPDDLYLWPTLSLVIEVKNEAEYDAIPQKDAEQLLHSMQSFRDNYPFLKDSAVPVMVVKATRARPSVHLPDGTRIMTPTHLDALLAAVSKLAVALAQKPAVAWTVDQVMPLLNDLGLSQARFVAQFTTPAK